MLIRVVGILIAASCAGCVSSGASRCKPDFTATFAPLRIGMTKEAVDELVPPYEIMLFQVSPGQLAPGGEADLPNVGTVYFVFDDEHKVAHLEGFDLESHVYRGLGIGSTFDELSTCLPDIEVVRWRGYGTLVTAPELRKDGIGLYFCFGWEPPVSATSRVGSIELKKLGPFQYASLEDLVPAAREALDEFNRPQSRTD